MPALGESVTEGTVTNWLKAVGDEVSADEPLLEVSTDKVDTEIPAPASGVLIKIVAQEDDVVEIGGELKGRGVKPDAQPWWVEIERVESSTAPRTVAALYDLAMATSGDYRRAFEHKGRLYPHTLDGATGRPVSNALASVTVLHASAMKADAYATALTVMGPFEGPEFAAAYGLAAHFVERTSRGPIERMTPLFAAMLVDDDDDQATAPLQ